MIRSKYRFSKALTFGLLVMLTTAFGLSGCGSDGYDNPDVELYQNDASTQTLVEAATVKGWVDNSCIIPETKQRVVILDCMPNPDGIFPSSDTDSWFAGDKAKILANLEKQYGGKLSPQYIAFSKMDEKLFGHIPGAIPNVSHEGYEVTNRDDGPILAEHEVGTGALIDQLLQKHGITKNDVLVLSTSRYDYPAFCQTRLWWTLRYWGFPKENIRVLNGGNKAYALAGYPLQKGVTLPAINPSNISVADFPQRFLNERISIGELISLVDSGRTTLADTDPNKVIVLDTRQPPVGYYFKDDNTDSIPDVFQVGGYPYDPATKLFSGNLTLSELLFDRDNDTTTGLNIPFSATTNPPIDLTAAPASDYLAMHGINGGPLAIPLSAKPASFEGIVRGAKITKTGAFNITVPALTLPNGAFKTKDDLLPVFAKAGIDGSKPVVVYCNSGSLAAIYYYALKEICGFQNVRLYDGSWQEWGNLTAFEPADTTYVMNDDYTAFPGYPAPSPAVVFFAGQNKYFTYDPAEDKFKDSQTGAEIVDPIKAGGTLGDTPQWDTVTRSEFVMFRPTATVQSPALDINGDGTANYRNKTYSSVTDWPTVRTTPTYIGDGNRIRQEDEAYQGAAPSSGGEAPSAFIPKGGGC